MLQWFKDFFRSSRQSICQHDHTSAKTTFDPDSTMGAAGWAFMDWKCEECGLTSHRIIPAPPEMLAQHRRENPFQHGSLLAQVMRDEAKRNRLH